MEAMEFWYLGNWRSLFLFWPSHTFTTPSHPPVAKVPCLSKNKVRISGDESNKEREKEERKRNGDSLWVEGNTVDWVDHLHITLLGTVALEGVLLGLDFRGRIKVFHRDTSLNGAQHVT